MSNIVKGSGIIYTTSKPNTIPNTQYDAEFAIDVNGNQYAWNRSTSVWDNVGQGIEIATSSAVPTHTPSNFRPRFLVTPDRKFYYYSGSWEQISPNLPNGLISSSAQIGPTGIYSGSGTTPAGTITNTYTDNDDNYNFLWNTPGTWERQESGDFFRQFGLEWYNELSEDYWFMGMHGEESTPQIYHRNASGQGNRFMISSAGIQLISQDDNGNTKIMVFGVDEALKYAHEYNLSGSSDLSIPDIRTVKIMSRGVISSSAQIGPTGIYSGSGTVNHGTSASIQDYEDPFLFINVLFNTSGNYERVYGDTFRQIGFEMVNDIYGVYNFVGINRNEGTSEMYYKDTSGYVKCVTINQGAIQLTAEGDGNGKIVELHEVYGLRYNSTYDLTSSLDEKVIPDIQTVKKIIKPYKVYNAIIKQTGTTEPTATILENTFTDTLTWYYNDPGEYFLESSGNEFKEGKVQIFLQGMPDSRSPSAGWSAYVANSLCFWLFTTDSSGNRTDSIINTYTNDYGITLEIRVYP